MGLLLTPVVCVCLYFCADADEEDSVAGSPADEGIPVPVAAAIQPPSRQVSEKETRRRRSPSPSDSKTMPTVPGKIKHDFESRASPTPKSEQNNVDKLNDEKLKPFADGSASKDKTSSAGVSSVGRLSKNAWPFAESDKSTRHQEKIVKTSVHQERTSHVSKVSAARVVNNKPEEERSQAEERKMSHPALERKPSTPSVSEPTKNKPASAAETRRTSIKMDVVAADARKQSVDSDAGSVSLERRNSKKLPNDCWPPRTTSSSKRGSVSKDEPIVLPGRRGSSTKVLAAAPRTPTNVSLFYSVIFSSYFYY